MLIKQLSIFLPNQKGHLAKVTKLLLEHNIDIRAIVLFDTADYGIMRAIVDQPDKALELLQKEGFVAKISKVLAVEPEDRPGSLHELYALLADNDMNIDYTYSFVMKKNEMPYFIFKVDRLEQAAELLCQKGYKVINLPEICS